MYPNRIPQYRSVRWSSVEFVVFNHIRVSEIPTENGHNIPTATVLRLPMVLRIRFLNVLNPLIIEFIFLLLLPVLACLSLYCAALYHCTASVAQRQSRRFCTAFSGIFDILAPPVPNDNDDDDDVLAVHTLIYIYIYLCFRIWHSKRIQIAVSLSCGFHLVITR